MGYYDVVGSSQFKKREDGTYIFFPNGIFGYGYIISENDMKYIKSYIEAYCAVGFFIAIALGLLFVKYIFLFPVILAAFFIAYRLKMKAFLKDKEKTNEKKSYKFALKPFIDNVSVWSLWLDIILGLCAFVLGIFFAVVIKENIKDVLFSIFSIVIAVSFILFGIYGLKLKRLPKDNA